MMKALLIVGILLILLFVIEVMTYLFSKYLRYKGIRNDFTEKERKTTKRREKIAKLIVLRHMFRG